MNGGGYVTSQDGDDTTEGEEYNKLLAHAKSYLPFLKKVINTESLGIQEEHLNKLRSLYEMVDNRRLSLSKLKSCQSVFCSLYSKYHSVLTKDQKEMNNSKNLVQLNEGENRTKFSDVGLISNKCDQKINSKSEHSSKMSISSAIKSNILNNQLDSSLEIEHKQNNDSIIKKFSFPPKKNDELSSSKDDDGFSKLAKNDLNSEFLDSRLRLNKVIGFAANASIEKLNKSDNTISHSELAKQIYDEITKQSKNTANCQNMLKGINMDDIDVNHVKHVIESIKKTNIIESSSFPSVNLMDSEVADVKLISPIESKTDHVTLDNVISTPSNSQSTCSMVPSKSTSIREKLNNAINVLHKIGPGNEYKQKFITALKPGTLIDLENSKVTRTSLHMESLRPVIKLNEKKADIKLSVPEIIVPRDPRIRNKSLLNPEKNINLIQLPSQTNVQQMIPTPITPQIQNPSSVNIPSLMSLNLPIMKSTFFESRPEDHLEPMKITSQQEVSNSALPGYKGTTNFHNLQGHSNTQLLNQQFSTEHSGNSNQSQFNNCRPLVQNQYTHNHRNDFTFDTQKNDFNQYSVANQVNVNPVYHNETMRYHDPVASSSSSYKFCNNITVNRDPRSKKRIQKLHKPPQFRNFKEFREAKYGKKINSNSGSSKSKKGMNHSQDNDSYTFNSERETLKNIFKTDTKNIKTYNDFGMLSDSANIKNFKIPKIKRKDETETIKGNIEKNITELIKDDITEKDVKLETITNNNTKNDTKPKTIKDNNIEKDTKIEPIGNNNIEKDLKIESIQIDLEKLNDPSNINKNEVNINTKQSCVINEPTKELCKPKKPKKYSKEKEFEKIVKEAVESLLFSNDDVCGPRTRTRSSLRRKEDSPNLKKIITSSENENKIAVEECSKISNNKYDNTKNVSETIETGQNVISSTSKESSEIDSSTEVVSKSYNENIVSSDEINSTADMTSNPKIDETVLMNILSNPKLMSVISILQDEGKMNKLTKLLESTEVDISNDDVSKNKNIVNKDHNDIEKKKKCKKKMKKEKKKKRKMKKNFESEESSHEESKNELLKHVSDNDDINNDNIKRTKKVNSFLDDSSDDCKISSNSDNNYDHSPTDQVNLKSSKRKKSQEYYGNFEILKDSCQTNLKDLKIVIAKFDKNVKIPENLNSDVSSSSIQTTNETIQGVKPKKPFLGPLSVKLARQKLEIESNHSRLNEITQLESEINTIPKNEINDSESIQSKKEKRNSKSMVNVIHDSYVVIEPIENISIQSALSKETPICKVSTIEQNTSKVTLFDTNIVQNKSDIKKPKPKMTELDKLHADISEMYDSHKLLNVPNVRQCRMNKQIDYVNTKHATVSKKNKTSSVKQLDLHVNQNKKSTRKLNENKPVVKNNNTKTVKTTVINKKTNVFQHGKLVKLKSKNKKNKKLNKKVNYKDSPLNVSNIEITTGVLSKVLTVNDFKDKSYFQTIDNILECKFCNYKDMGLNIVRHYKKLHYKEEVLPSRLSTNCAEILINNSLKDNFELSNSEQYEDLKSSKCVSANICFTCIFCRSSFDNIITFYDHISSHTGEYRYKCKMCEKIYPNENELEKHIFKHSVYDKTDGISHLLKPNPIQKTKLFGYLCSFCNYIQLDYNNIVNHMTLRHFGEDKKLNGHWTVIRVNMADENESFKNSIIDYNNLVGCLPPIQYKQDVHQNVSKDIVQEDKKQLTNSVPELLNKELLIDNSVSIKKEGCVQEVVNDSPKSTMLQLSPKQSNLTLESKISADHMNDNSEYTLKEGSTKCTVGSLSCEIINSVLLFKCSASGCLNNQFSTVILIDVFKHIELNHQFLVWDRKCNVCKHKIEMISEQCFLKNALEHIIAHHLVLKKNEQPNMLKRIDLHKKQNKQETVKNTNTEEKPVLSLRVRYLPGDLLSNRDTTIAKKEERNLKADGGRIFVLRNDCEHGSVGCINCDKLDDALLFKCLDKSCLNEFETVFYEELAKHIEVHHKITIWDGMCNICGYGLWRKFNYLYMEHALEHLVTQHLIEYTASKSDTSVITNDSLYVNEAPSEINVSNRKDEELREQILDNFEQSSLIELKNPFNTTADLTNINEVSNNSGFLMFPLIEDVRSLKKNNLRKANTNTNAYKTNLSEPSDMVTMWMKMKTNYEVILPTTSVLLEPGQHIINKGLLINGTYCLIDTTGSKKDYNKRARELPMNMMKTRLAFNEMTCLPKLLGLYKCMDRTCTKIFSQKELFKLHMQLHFSNMEKKKKNQSCNAEQFKKCAYCLRVFESVDALAYHIKEKYTYCNYFCRYCFYRAYTPSHVLVHQSKIHTECKPSVIKLEFNASDDEIARSELLMAVDFNEFILPFICSVGHCTFSCFLHNEYISHLNEEHQQCDKFYCYICANEAKGEGFFAFQTKSMINHFKLHNINTFQCIFCLFGTEVIDSMLVHLAMEHFEYDSICLERSPVSDTCDAKQIENLKIIKIDKAINNGFVEVVNLPPGTSSLPEILPQRPKKKRFNCPNVLPAAMESANINTNTQLSDTIIITVPDRAQMTNDNTSSITAIDNEFIMLDDAKNQNNETDEPFKINVIWTEGKSNKVEPQKLNDDIIVIDDDDELLENQTSNTDENIKISTKQRHLSKHSVEESTDGLNKARRLAHPLIPLINLFTCNGCDSVLSSGDEYHTHLMNCLSIVNGFLCPYCVKRFKTAFNMTEHVKLHGPDRFSCSFCSIKVPSVRAITHHMKIEHKITQLDFVSVHNNSTDIETDEFIVFEDKMTKTKSNINICYICEQCLFKGNNLKTIDSHMKNIHSVDNYEVHTVDPPSNNYTEEYLIKIPSIEVLKPQREQTGLKRKCVYSNTIGNKKRCKQTKDNTIQEKPKTMLFSSDTIEDIPKSHIFSEPIGCLLCTYNTKVRSNLILHLNGHKIGQDNTTKEIVNPVPIKSELMFDKMINLSASSFEAMNTEKMKIIELNKKIVEVAFQGNLNLELYPPFIPKNKRYKCSIPSCTYTGMTEDMLKKHISILHSDFQCYICPHCLPSCTLNKVVELNNIEFHLMHHSENLYKCQYCDYIDFNRDEMKTHMRLTHLALLTSENQSNIIVIRQTMLKDDSIDRNRLQARSIAAQWICNVCCSGIRYTENEITSHIFMAHNISNMFKCPMCQFEHKDDDPKVFEEHYKLKHPSVAVKSLRVFEKITNVEIEEQQKQAKRLLGAANVQEQQALESIETSRIPPTCRGIPIEITSASRTFNKSRSISKSPKSAAKSSSLFHGRKQKLLTDIFSVDDSLGTITSTGLFSCPRCNVFVTMNIDHFRDHLFKDVNFKIWKCMKCFEVSDSPKKMAWHVKKHGNGSKYEKIESAEKLHWVEQVIVHQNTLIKELKKNKDKHIDSVEQNTTVVSDKKTSCSPLKKKEDNIECEKNDNVINLLDDSDD